MKISNSKFSNNVATIDSATGGALFSFKSKIEISDSVFTSNKAGNVGTAVSIVLSFLFLYRAVTFDVTNKTNVAKKNIITINNNRGMIFSLVTMGTLIPETMDRT